MRSQSFTAVLSIVVLLGTPAYGQTVAPPARDQIEAAAPGVNIEVHLRSGGKLTGSVAARGPDSFQLQTTSSARLRVTPYQDVLWAGTPLQVKIWRMTMGQRVDVTMVSGMTLRGRVLSAQAASFLLEPEGSGATVSAAGSAVTLAYAEVASVHERKLNTAIRIAITVGAVVGGILVLGAAICSSPKRCG